MLVEFAELDDGSELAAAIRDAASEEWSVRIAAGRRLAAAADVPSIAAVLERLLLDDMDTGVCQETADALLERREDVSTQVQGYLSSSGRG
jgi:hypothetical protein